MKRKFIFPRKEPRFAPWLFSLSWEQREFGEIVSEYVDPVSTPTKGYYRLGIKSHAKGTFHSYVRPGMELGTAQMHRVAANNFIVNITFGWEHAVAITTEDDAGKLVSHRFPQFSFSAGMVPAYFKYLILDEDFRHHLWLASPGGAGRNRVLKISEMLEYKFWVPSQEEQQKISILLTKLDSLITLHQRGANSWGRVRFPRFCSTTIFWEQRKLGEVCGSLEYGLNAAAKEYDGENKYIRITDIDDNTRLFLTSDLTSPDTNLKDAARYRLEAGDIVFARTGASVGKSYIYKRSDGTVYYAGFLIRAKVKQEYSADFVFQNTLSQNYEKYILITSQRSGQPGVNAQEYAEYTFSVPEYEEQKKIGTFLTNLDGLITLHQCKSRLLSELRKMQILPENALLRRSLTTAWEQRKLGDITSSYSGGTPAVGNKEFYDGKIPFIRSGEIHSSTTELFINDKALDSSSAKMVRAGDILYALYGATSGEVSRSQIDGAINQAILAIIPDSEHDSDYLVEWLRKEKQNIISTYLQGGQGNLSAQIVKELLIPIATPEEQQKIGRIFREINDLITLHQRESELVRNRVKTAFWRTSLNYYDGWLLRFTSAWEQRRLGDVVDRVVRKNTNNESSLPLTISAQYGLVDQITYFNNRVASRDVSNYYLVLNGEFAYNKSSSDGFPFGTIKRLDLYDMGVLSTLYIVFSIKDADLLNSDFLTVYFDTNRWHKGVSERAAEGARNHGLLNISAEDFLDIDITIPSDEKEQAAIGSLFEEIDRLITLHQREFTHTNPNTNYVKYYQRNRPLLCVLRSMDKSV